ncbi:anthranilate synthase component II [Thermogymnomonas acidicola]|uniref:anthranilate synthase component II n=1 Tax=Thermogymnomonas acidicola TaxID=399579 RepID=UPI001E3C0302|nr:aminodeoxychorismate/anthranilate synthase component II [Thermogymnomonas acidicola]
MDNHDSFVYNLVQLIEEQGADVRVIYNDMVTPKSALSFDRVVISPGPGTPLVARDRGHLLEMLENDPVKTLGVCFGHQVIGYFLGSRVIRAGKLMHGQVDGILNSGGGVLRGLPQRFVAIRYHSLAIEPSDRVVVDAVAESDGTVMAFHSTDGRFMGVQFHPESYYSEHGSDIIRNFLGD